MYRTASTPANGVNYFRVEASLEAATEYLRPGMQGVGKILIDERKLLWTLTYDMVNWLRLWVWSWWPWS